MKRVLGVVLSTMLICLCSCSHPVNIMVDEGKLKTKTLALEQNNLNKVIVGTVGDYFIYGISNDTFDNSESETVYYMYSLIDGTTTPVGSIKNAFASTGDTVILKDEIYFTMSVERDISQTLLYCINTSSKTLAELDVLGTDRPLVFCEPADKNRFLLFDCGKEQENYYHSYVNLFNADNGEIVLLQENIIDTQTNQGVLLCSVSYYKDSVYLLKQFTDGQTHFVIEKLDLQGNILESYSLNWLDEYFKDPDSNGMYKLILSFVVSGENVFISDFSGTGIVFNLDKEILYEGERLGDFRLNMGSDFLLVSYIDNQDSYVLSPTGLSIITDEVIAQADAIWSGPDGNMVISITTPTDMGKTVETYHQLLK